MTVDPTASRLAAAGVAYAPQIARAARRHGLDPNLLAAVAAQETGGPGTNAGRNVVGDGGHGRGLFQIDDRWHAFASSAKAMDPSSNADYAAGMLEGLLDRYGNVHEALSAYNAGSPDATGTQTSWPGGSRLGYADSVLRHYDLIAGGQAPTGSAPSRSTGVGSAAGNSAVAFGSAAFPAMALPLQAPAPSAPQGSGQPYHRQATDYGALFDTDGDGDGQ
jgi:hypothetical protein